MVPMGLEIRRLDFLEHLNAGKPPPSVMPKQDSGRGSAELGFADAQLA